MSFFLFLPLFPVPPPPIHLSPNKSIIMQLTGRLRGRKLLGQVGAQHDLVGPAPAEAAAVLLGGRVLNEPEPEPVLRHVLLPLPMRRGGGGEVEDAVVGVEVEAARDGEPHEPRVRDDDDDLLGARAQPPERRPRTRQ